MVRSAIAQQSLAHVRHCFQSFVSLNCPHLGYGKVGETFLEEGFLEETFPEEKFPEETFPEETFPEET